MGDAEQTEEDLSFPKRLYSPICSNLLHICFCIAAFDFIQSMYFVVQATTLLILHFNLYSVVAFLGSIFWILMVLLLIVGLWKGRLAYIVSWLVFTLVGILVDIFFFIWTIAISEFVHFMQIVNFTLLYLGIVCEWLCIYVVYHYCLKIDSFSEVDERSMSIIKPENVHLSHKRSYKFKDVEQGKSRSKRGLKSKPADEPAEGDLNAKRPSKKQFDFPEDANPKPTQTNNSRPENTDLKYATESEGPNMQEEFRRNFTRPMKFKR